MSIALNQNRKLKISNDQVYKMQISQRYKDEILIIRQRELDFELKKEFEEWNKLSDEAFLNFEGTL